MHCQIRKEAQWGENKKAPKDITLARAYLFHQGRDPGKAVDN